jgi:hypothetical protein
MSRSTQTKAALVALLAGIVLVNQPAARDWFTAGFLAFGILNVLFAPPGTLAVRAPAIAATLAALVLPDVLRLPVMLLVSALFLGEGVLCVLMSAPLFYAIALAIAAGMDRARRRFDKPTTSLLSCVMLLVTVPMSLEGVTPFTTLNRDESVTETRIIQCATKAQRTSG